MGLIDVKTLVTTMDPQKAESMGIDSPVEWVDGKIVRELITYLYKETEGYAVGFIGGDVIVVDEESYFNILKSLDEKESIL